MSFRKQVQKSAIENSDKPFLWCMGQSFSFGDALCIKDQFETLLGKFDHVAIISNSGSVAYMSIFATVLLDATFMHLNIDWHESRILNILGLATPEIVVCHKDWAADRADMFKALKYDAVANVENAGGIFESLSIFRKRRGEGDKLAEYKSEKVSMIYFM